tara:strand:+ start:137 stop:409 length:273 start_codon:yes stop_codon:yes gene_type:complete
MRRVLVPIFRFTAIFFMLSLGAGLVHELYHAKRPPDIAESYLAEAERLYAAGDYALAVRRLSVAAELSDDDIAHYRLFEAREKLKTEQAP